MTISSLHKKLSFIKEALKSITETTLILPVVLTIIGLMANLLVIGVLKVDAFTSSLNGSIEPVFSIGADSSVFLENISNPYDGQRSFLNDSQDLGFIIIGDSAVLNTGNPQSSVITHRDGLVVYK